MEFQLKSSNNVSEMTLQTVLSTALCFHAFHGCCCPPPGGCNSLKFRADENASSSLSVQGELDVGEEFATFRVSVKTYAFVTLFDDWDASGMMEIKKSP
jgi:hypothetical protein